MQCLTVHRHRLDIDCIQSEDVSHNSKRTETFDKIAKEERNVNKHNCLERKLDHICDR